MKQRVSLNAIGIVSTLASIGLFVGFIIFEKQPDMRLVLAGVLAVIVLFGLFYMPLSISADKYAIYIRRFLRVKAIPMSDVKSVTIFPVPLKAMRLCGSGGFMGYWGWFREPGIGRYFAYYGDPRDCFLVELSNGRKYVLGCRNAGAMVEHIRGMMK